MATQSTISEITYTWICNTVDVYPTQGDYTNLVHNVYYIVLGELTNDTEITSTKVGKQTLDTTNVTNFIPFDELTNEQIVTWTKSAMGEELVLAIETDIANQIELLRNPVSVTMTIPYNR